MMAGLADLPVVKATFDEASDALSQDLWTLAQEGPAEAQNQTVNTQPLMLAAGVATWRAWRDANGAMPVAVAGHSLGEYTALVAAESIRFRDALQLVRFRAEAMQAAVPAGIGGIAAVLGLEADAVRAVCAEAAEGEVLEAVNLNSPGQIVIAGHRAAVERGLVLAKARGAKRALMLPMSVPSHCSLMQPAAEKLALHLEGADIQSPRFPVIHNADVSRYTSAIDIRAALVRQLYSPVRWIETVESLVSLGASTIVECVPGKVLTGLNKRIAASANCLAVSDQASLTAAVDATRR
jgi:[acyl-carrier-protein] S-malonyltransferase